MTRNTQCCGSPGSTGMQRGHRQSDGPEAPDVGPIALTQRKTRRIVPGGVVQIAMGEIAGQACLVPGSTTPPAFFPGHHGRRSMSSSRGAQDSFSSYADRLRRTACRRQRSAGAGARRGPVAVQPRPGAGRPDHLPGLDGGNRIFRHLHSRFRGGPAARASIRSTKPSSTRSRATLRVFDVSALGGPPSGQLVYTPQPFEVLASQIGQVFGLAYDDGVRDGVPSGIPDLYAAATSLHGIRIVTPDADDDGRPERERRGVAGASFMEGQFGVENGGGPGTIWRIDGITGAGRAVCRHRGQQRTRHRQHRLRQGASAVLRLRPRQRPDLPDRRRRERASTPSITASTAARRMGLPRSPTTARSWTSRARPSTARIPRPGATPRTSAASGASPIMAAASIMRSAKRRKSGRSASAVTAPSPATRAGN